MTIAPELLEILACPKCKEPVVLSDDQAGLICRTCGLLYPIDDGIPVMLAEEARPLDAGTDE